jgi:hypothetical protein
MTCNITGKIVQSTVEECREAYAIWINMVIYSFFLDMSYQVNVVYWMEGLLTACSLIFQAHELLKQKNLEKQG